MFTLKFPMLDLRFFFLPSRMSLFSLWIRLVKNPNSLLVGLEVFFVVWAVLLFFFFLFFVSCRNVINGCGYLNFFFFFNRRLVRIQIKLSGGIRYFQLCIFQISNILKPSDSSRNNYVFKFHDLFLFEFFFSRWTVAIDASSSAL